MPVEQAYSFLLSILFYMGIYTIVVISLNMEAGYMGLPNFGKMMGVAAGAFTTSFFTWRLALYLHNRLTGEPIVYSDYVRENAMIVSRINEWLSTSPGISLFLLLVTLIASLVIGAVIGYIASYPAIRLREDYLGITLLAMAEVIRVIGYNYKPIAGGTLGMQVPDLFRWAGQHRFSASVLIIVAIALIVYLVYQRMLSTPFGRVLRAIRDDEEAVSSLGRDIVAYRKRVISAGTATAALAGALYALYTGSVIATAYDRVTWTFWPWVMMMLGGAGNNVGVLLGVGVFVIARTTIYTYKNMLEAYVPFNVVWLDYLLLSVTIIAILMLRPQGILPEKPIRTIKPLIRQNEST